MLTASGTPKRIEMGLGNTSVVSLEEARAKALEAKRVARQGINPLQADASRIPTFEAVARAFYESNKSTWENGKHVQQWINTLQTYVFPKIGGYSVDLVDQQQVLECVEPIWNTKRETARRILQRIGKVLDVARAKGYRTSENPVEIIKRANVLSRTSRACVEGHAALAWGDVPAFWVELIGRAGTASLALQFTILTAARTSETLGAAWSEIDLEAGTWTIPGTRMKAKKPHVVPLSGQAKALLLRMHNTCRGDLVFEGQRTGQSLSNMAMAQLLRRMGRTDITVHGFRTSFRTWCGDSSVDREVAEMALAHSIGNAVEQAYARSELLERRREVMENWADYIVGD